MFHEVVFKVRVVTLKSSLQRAGVLLACSCYDPMMTLILSCTEVTQLYVTPETLRKFPFIMADKGRLHCGYTFCFFLL